MANNKSNCECRIIYGAGPIVVEFLPGCANFSYWIYFKINEKRWRRKSENDIWLTAEVTEAEAEYVEQLARAQWGPEGCEVIGKPEKAVCIAHNEHTEIVAEKTEKIEKAEKERQLSLF